MKLWHVTVCHSCLNRCFKEHCFKILVFYGQSVCRSHTYYWILDSNAPFPKYAPVVYENDDDKRFDWSFGHLATTYSGLKPNNINFNPYHLALHFYFVDLYVEISIPSCQYRFNWSVTTSLIKSKWTPIISNTPEESCRLYFHIIFHLGMCVYVCFVWIYSYLILTCSYQAQHHEFYLKVLEA